MADFTFGSDPEFMLVDSSGKYRSAIGVIHGTKEDKVSLGNGAYAFYDNVLAEVNVKPGRTKPDVIKNFGDCFKKLAKLVGNLRITPQASHTYDLDECQHEDALKFGCEPEFCLYVRSEEGRIMRMEPPQVDPTNPFRTAGGHIHIGSETCLPWNGKILDVLQMLDLFVGVPAVVMCHDHTAKARTDLYGGAGTHRVKMEYGLEYRTLSDFWLVSPRMVAVVYDLVNLVLDLVESGENSKIPFEAEKIRSIINKGQKSLATEMTVALKSWMPKKLYKEVGELANPQMKFDFYKEWNLS
jgi:hypothetical protein